MEGLYTKLWTKIAQKNVRQFTPLKWLVAPYVGIDFNFSTHLAFHM